MAAKTIEPLQKRLCSHQVAGWDADFDGQSISGRDLCRAVWAGTFDASREALVVAALGWQPDALGNVQVPSNAFCVNSFAQVELLRSGVDVFVTHGGQNSFTEALSCATPVVVCPGFGDQEVNAAKAVRLGVGLKVDRPRIASQDEASQAAAMYRLDVCHAVKVQAEGLDRAGGVPRAVSLVLKAGDQGGLHPWSVTACAGA